MTLSGRFVLLVAVGVVPTVLAGATAGAAWLVAACWLLACLLLAGVDLAAAASPRRLAIERDLPARVRLGEEVTSRLTVRNLGTRRMRGLLRDGWQPTAWRRGTDAAARIPFRLEAGASTGLWMLLAPRRRGELRTRLVTVRSRGPLGLAARQASLEVPGALRVLPPFRSRKHLPSRLARLQELDGRTSVLVRGQGTEFDSLREYVRGDDVRSIDWRATARRGAARPADGRPGGAPELVVRTWRPERDRRVLIVLDTSRLSAARIEDETRFDTAVETALLLAVLADRAGDRVDLLAFDRRVRARVAGARGAALLSRTVDALAETRPELIEMDWDAVPAQLDALTRRRSLVVLLTTIDAPGSSAGLLGVLPQLTARHTVLVGSVTDPAVREAVGRRHDREEVYRAAAAERALLDGARVAAAVRRLGADVVTATPEELPPAVSDRYLVLKAAGRL